MIYQLKILPTYVLPIMLVIIVLPKVGQNGLNWAFVRGSKFVLRLSFFPETPAFVNTMLPAI